MILLESIGMGKGCFTLIITIKTGNKFLSLLYLVLEPLFTLELDQCFK